MLNPGYSYSGSVTNRNDGSEGIVALALLFLFLCECQIVLGEYFTVSSVNPDLLLMAVIATGVLRGTNQGFWFGLYGGFLQEIASASGAEFGYLILMKMAVGYLCGKLTNSVRSSFVAVPVVMIAVVCFIYNQCLGLISPSFLHSGLKGALPVLVNAIVCGIPVYYIVYFIPGRISS